MWDSRRDNRDREGAKKRKGVRGSRGKNEIRESERRDGQRSTL